MEGVIRTHVIPPGKSHAGTTIHICRDAGAVSDVVCELVSSSCRAAADLRGYAALAVPGGSVLKMLGGLTDQARQPLCVPFLTSLSAPDPRRPLRTHSSPPRGGGGGQHPPPHRRRWRPAGRLPRRGVRPSP